MNRGLLTLSLSLLALAACSDGISPLEDVDALFARGGKSTTSGDGGSVVVGDGTTEPRVLQFADWAPRLQTYDTTFVTYQGWRKNLVIYFEDWAQFMILEIPTDAQFVDAQGRPLADGERVEIRVQVDSARIQLEFGPHGSTFTGRRPVKLWVWYKYSDLADSPEKLAVWYRATNDDAWGALPTEISKSGGWLKSNLYHFSNYLVAW